MKSVRHLYISLEVIFVLLLFTGIAAKPRNTTGGLVVKIVDGSSGNTIPVRVRLIRNGNAVNLLPKTAVAEMYGLWDHADGYGFQLNNSSYVDGSFIMSLPAGEYMLSLSKGNEYLAQQHKLTIEAGLAKPTHF